MLNIPLADGKTLHGTPEQFRRLAAYLQQKADAAPQVHRRAQVQLWDGQSIIGTYADLGILAGRFAALADPAPRARYTAPVALPAYTAGGIAFTLPGRVEPVTQTLNARGTTGGLRLPGLEEAQPAKPTALQVNRVAQPYLAQVCVADLTSLWGWTTQEPIYTAQAGHVLIAAVLITIQHRLLLTEDQILAVRWQRSPQWDCYLPATLLNSWSLLVAHHLQATRQSNSDHATVNLNQTVGPQL
jgi:hypothetical protein